MKHHANRRWPTALRPALLGPTLLGLILLLSCLPGLALALADKLPLHEVFEEHGVNMLWIEPDSGRIVDANPAAARFFGWSRDTLRSMHIQQINTFTPEQVAAERKLAETEGRNYFIFRHRLASGEIRTVEVHSRPFQVDGGRKLLLSIVNEITPGRHQENDLWHYQARLEEMVDAQVREIEASRRVRMWMMIVALLVQAVVIALLVVNIRRRHRLEVEREQLLASLQARNQELHRLGEVMAHHFQEPVRRLVSYAQRLLKHSELASDEDSRRSLGYIDTQARRLSALVSDVQRYLALDHAEVCSTATSDSGEVLRAAMAAAGESLEQVELTTLTPMPRVRVPEKLLKQFFAILLDNAVRYRHPERPLRIEVSARQRGNIACFRFADNGTGIEPEYREQVFGLFRRLVPSDRPGTGMGLALVYKMVQLAGGQVRIEDGLDGGACVYFELPMETGT